MRVTSIEEKEAQGTSRSDRNNETTATRYEGKIPRPQMALNRRAKKMYKDIVKIAIEDEAFKIQDAYLIADFCFWRELYLQGTEKVPDFDQCYETYEKGSNVTGQFTVLCRVHDKMKEHFPDLGIGNKARQNITQYVNQITIPFDNFKNPHMVKPQPSRTINIPEAEVVK
tara:strand:- start:47 stop:556 length:510 start_codon:yes stop_codon:yes gene_type:complete